MHSSSSPRVLRYLAIAGVVTPWDAVFYGGIAALGLYAVWMKAQADNALLAMLVLAPVLAGTGLLSIAREGRLDLLFGSGVSRWRVWTTAWTRAVVLPLLVIAACAALFVRSGGTTAGEAFVRALVVGAITMGVAFAAGSVQPRFALGVLWAGSRVVFLLSSRGREIYMQIVHPAQAGSPTFMRSVVGIFGFPEVLLYSPVSIGAVALAVGLSVLALLASTMIFLRADFGGHRTA